MKNKKMDQADSFDLRPASVEEAGLFHPDGETLVGRVTFASGERQEFTDHGAYPEGHPPRRRDQDCDL